MKIKNSVNILGAKYKIRYAKSTEDREYLSEYNWSGCCKELSKEILIGTKEFLNMDNDDVYEKYVKEITRHEVLHAFLNESGLSSSSFKPQAWAKNEEMIDWFAIQSPKIFKVYEELGVL